MEFSTSKYLSLFLIWGTKVCKQQWEWEHWELGQPQPGSWAELHLMEQSFNPGSVISFIHHRESCGRCGRVQIFSDDWSTPNIFLWYPNIFPSSCKNICESWVEKCNNYGFAGARCGQRRVMISIQSAARHNLTRSSAQIWSREVCRRTLCSHTFHRQ